MTENAGSLNAGDFGHTFEGYGDTSDATRNRYAQGFASRYSGFDPSQQTGQIQEAFKQMNAIQKQGLDQQVVNLRTGQTQMSQAVQQGTQQMTQVAETGATQAASSFQELGTNVQTAGTEAQTASTAFQATGTAAQTASTATSSVGTNFGSLGGAVNGLLGPLERAVPGLGQFSGIINQLVSSLFSGGAGGGGLGGLFKGIGSVFSSIFHEGGVVGAAAPGRYVSSMVFSGAVRLHSGLASDEYPAILRRGERVLTANDNARTESVIRGLSDQIAGANGRAGSTTRNDNRTFQVVNNIQTKDADSFRASRGQVMADAVVHLQRFGVRNG